MWQSHMRASSFQKRPTTISLCVALAIATNLFGCASFSSDGGMSVPAEVAARELHKEAIAIRTESDALSAHSQVEHLLKRPLTADTAVQIALLNNPGLQAAYNELGIVEAEMVRASLPPNPSFSFSRIAGPLEYDIEAAIAADVLALATLPARAEIAVDRFRSAQLKAAEETLRTGMEARRSYYRAVAARELADFLAEAKSAAEATAKLTSQLGETGAMNKLDLARSQVFQTETHAQFAAAQAQAATEREKLIRSLGLSGGDLDFKILKALPTLPRRLPALPNVEQNAVSRRIDLQIARIDLDVLAKSYGLTNATRFVNLLHLSGLYKDEMENVPREKVDFKDFGPGLTIEIPIFDLGEVRVREAEQIYMQALNRLAEKAVNVRSQAREAYRSYRLSYEIASEYERKILPLRKIISDETLLRYNGMLVDVFTLLAEARQRILSSIAAIEAKRNFWIAKANLQAAIIGGDDARPIDGKPETNARVEGQMASGGDRP